MLFTVDSEFKNIHLLRLDFPDESLKYISNEFPSASLREAAAFISSLFQYVTSDDGNLLILIGKKENFSVIIITFPSILELMFR